MSRSRSTSRARRRRSTRRRRVTARSRAHGRRSMRRTTRGSKPPCRGSPGARVVDGARGGGPSGEQATTPSDLEEEGEHREQGTQSTSTEGDHREEQGEQEGRRALIAGRAPPRRRVTGEAGRAPCRVRCFAPWHPPKYRTGPVTWKIQAHLEGTAARQNLALAR
jgi:hypothetical protein